MAEKKVKIVAIIDAESTGFTGTMNEVESRTKKSSSLLTGIFQGIGQQITRTFVDIGRYAVRQFAEGIKLAGRELVDALKLSSEFGEALSEVATLGIEDMDTLRAGVLDLSASMGLDLINSVKGLYQAISAGVPEDNVLDFLEVSSELAVAGLTDLETTVDGLTSVINSYGLSFDRAREISDMMFTTVRLGKTQIGELAQFIGRVTPLASQMGIEFEEVSAVLASATRSGIKTRLAVTGLKAAISNILTPSEQAIRVFDEMGLTVNEVGEMVREGGLIEFLRQLTPDQLKEVITSVEGLNTILAVVGQDGGAQFQQFLAEIQEGAGATEKAVQEVLSATARQWKIMQATIDAIRVELVQPIEEYAGRVLKILNDNLLTPLREEIAPLIGLALEGFFLGDNAQAALETIGIWSKQAIERMGRDLETALKGEISFGDMIDAWIRDGWIVIKPAVMEIARNMAEIFWDVFSEVMAVGFEAWKKWWIESMKLIEIPDILKTLALGMPPIQIAKFLGLPGVEGITFHDGGIVPDLLGGGREYPVIVEPGERIIKKEENNRTDRTDATYNVKIIIDGAKDPRSVAMEVKRILRDNNRMGRGWGEFAPELA